MAEHEYQVVVTIDGQRYVRAVALTDNQLLSWFKGEVEPLLALLRGDPTFEGRSFNERNVELHPIWR